MYEFIVHDDAAADLEEIIQQDEVAGLQLLQLIEQLDADQDLLDRLSQRDYGGTPTRPVPRTAFFNTGMWVAQQAVGLNLWRMRFFGRDVNGYRLVYAFFPADRYILLGIAEKKPIDATDDDERFDYELSHPISRRISNAYWRLVDGEW